MYVAQILKLNSRKINGIAFNSLEVVESLIFTSSLEEMESMRSNYPDASRIPKTLVIKYMKSRATPLTKKLCAKACSICHPGLKIEFNVVSSWRGAHSD